MGIVPDLNDYWDELGNFFAWLNGEECLVEVTSIDPDDKWAPPALEWQRGQNEWIEPIRYAAVNRLLVNLGYGFKTRLVEPYSLRRTQAGDLLFYAVKVSPRVIRGYRADRIQSIEVTKQPFKPVFPVEFTPKGRIPVPQTQRRQRFVSSRSSRNYVVECAVCGKRFYRKKYSLRINRHQRQDSIMQCPGRHGYLV